MVESTERTILIKIGLLLLAKGFEDGWITAKVGTLAKVVVKVFCQP